MSALQVVSWRLRKLVGRKPRATELMGLGVLAAVMLAGLLSPLGGYVPGTDVAPAAASLPPGPGHWLGTDHLGRDVLCRTLYAASSFVWPGLLATLTGAALGVGVGGIAGFSGAVAARALRYLTAVIASLPRFVLILLVCAIYGNDLMLLAITTGIAYAPTLAEAVFSRVSELGREDHVLAHRAHGLPDWQILWVHLVAVGCGRLVARHMILLFAYFVVLETTLSYLGGLGVQEPTPSWGNMLVFEWGRGHLVTSLAPAAALWITLLATTWVSELFSEASHG